MRATMIANGGSLMNRIKRLLLKQNKNQNAWKATLSIASLALVASISVGASNLQANADDTAKKSPVATVEEEITNARSEFMLKITDALIAGKLTPEDAAQKMISFEEGIVEKMQYLRGIQERIEHAVTSGEMTREEAEAKYSAMLKDKKENPGDARAQAYLKKVGAELKQAVANGDMTSEEGKAKYAEAEARIEKRMGKKNEGNKRAEVYLAQVGAEIKEAIANGDMTAKEGKAKYAETVKALAQRMASAKSNGKSKQITREDYAQAKAKMLRMVKAGEITREQMQERLDGMKKAMSGGDREEASDRREEVSDDCMALRRRIGEAVRNGDMTREEAGKIWEEEGC